jgi:nucleotide-binding universal stress UspA family protein
VNVITWIVEGTWPACVDATRAIAPADAEIVLLHVTGGDAPAAAQGAYAGLLGRGRPDRDPGQRLAELGAASAREMLDAAAGRLNRRCSVVQRRGRVEREVVAAAEGADLLVVARDGDDARLGPRSLGPASRFVVDHAPCQVLLIWPRETPGADSIPPPPPGHGHGPHPRRR